MLDVSESSDRIFAFFYISTLLTWILRQPESGTADNKSSIQHALILTLLSRFLKDLIFLKVQIVYFVFLNFGTLLMWILRQP